MRNAEEMTSHGIPQHIKLGERHHVERPLLDQLSGLDWEVIEIGRKQYPGDTFRTSFIEGRSTGISKVLKVMKENGSPPPEFETDEDRSYFLIRLPVHPKAESDASALEDTKAKTSEKMSEKILAEIRHDPNVTIADLSERSGVTTRTVERNLKKLQESGLLERIGPPKGGHWVVKEES